MMIFHDFSWKSSFLSSSKCQCSVTERNSDNMFDWDPHPRLALCNIQELLADSGLASWSSGWSACKAI